MAGLEWEAWGVQLSPPPPPRREALEKRQEVHSSGEVRFGGSTAFARIAMSRQKTYYNRKQFDIVYNDRTHMGIFGRDAGFVVLKGYHKENNRFAGPVKNVKSHFLPRERVSPLLANGLFRASGDSRGTQGVGGSLIRGLH